MFRPYELDYWHSVLTGLAKPGVPIVPYLPQRRQPPTRTLADVPSAWNGIENILAELIERFQVGTQSCLEFGVERGFSTAALSSFFDSVTGVDTFRGDVHTATFDDLYQETSQRLAPYPNITLIRSDYRDFIHGNDRIYDLIHVDIIHTYAATFECGLWSAQHSSCAIFHDTESFPAVKRAVTDIARITQKTFHNFKECNGLGILV